MAPVTYCLLYLDEELRREEQTQKESEQASQAMYEHPIHHHHHYDHYDGMHQMAPEDYDNLMPDPLQFVSMMGAPPPPPMVPPPQPERADKNEPVLPPGKTNSTQLVAFMQNNEFSLRHRRGRRRSGY